jgi:hypothetical protein
LQASRSDEQAWLRHNHIRDEQIRLQPVQGIYCLLAVKERMRLKPRIAQNDRQVVRDHLLVIDNEHDFLL